MSNRSASSIFQKAAWGRTLTLGSLLAILTPACLSAAPASPTGTAPPPNPDQAIWHVFKEPRPLHERPGELAVFDPQEAAQGKLAGTLDAAGLDVRSLHEHPIAGWWTADVSPKAGALPIRDLVAQAAKALPSQFVTPIFGDENGDPLFPTPVLLVRFGEGVPQARAEQIFQQLGSGTILERNWGNMPGAYRIASTAKTGYDVLASANKLAVHPEVRYAEPDMVFTGRGQLIPTDPNFASSWGLHNTGQTGGVADEDLDAPEAWDIQTGDPNVRVLVLDTGVQNHPDLNTIGGFDATGENGGGLPVNACDRHGTAVAGCITAAINNSLGSVGIAPNCRTVSARFAISSLACDGSWTAQFSWTVNCLAYGESILVRISNNSNGYGSESSAITDKYNSSYTGGGMVHFSSAGNNASSTIGYPARIPLVNAVAALSSNGVRAAFSDYGTGLDFSAPGDGIFSTDLVGTDGFSTTDYANVFGTSFASPYVAGVAALLQSQSPGLANFQIENHLRATCVDKGTAGYDTDYGWGAVNARAAVEAVVVCDYALSDDSQEFPPAGGSHFFTVMVSHPCPWTAVSNASWVTLTFAGTGTGAGPGTITYTVAPNTGGARVARITVDNLAHVITQAAPPPPGNDNLVAATAISGATGTATGTSGGATKQTGEPNHGGQFGGASVWWSWTAPSSGPAVVTTDGSSFDTVLGVYLGTNVAALTSVATDDDSGEGTRSRVAFPATRGAVYRIAVDGVQSAAGSIQLHWALSPVSQSFMSPTQKLSVISAGPGFQTIFYNYSTGALSASPFHPGSTLVPFTQPPAEWIGLFHYDYGAQRFTQGLYRTTQGL